MDNIFSSEHDCPRPRVLIESWIMDVFNSSPFFQSDSVLSKKMGVIFNDFSSFVLVGDILIILKLL